MFEFPCASIYGRFSSPTFRDLLDTSPTSAPWLRSAEAGKSLCFLLPYRILTTDARQATPLPSGTNISLVTMLTTICQTLHPHRLHVPLLLVMDPHELLFRHGAVLLPDCLFGCGRHLRHCRLQDLEGTRSSWCQESRSSFDYYS